MASGADRGKSASGHKHIKGSVLVWGMRSVPGADRGLRAGSPRGVVEATGYKRNGYGTVVHCCVVAISELDFEKRTFQAILKKS